jgi:hypothetical protein
MHVVEVGSRPWRARRARPGWDWRVWRLADIIIIARAVSWAAAAHVELRQSHARAEHYSYAGPVAAALRAVSPGPPVSSLESEGAYVERRCATCNYLVCLAGWWPSACSWAVPVCSCSCSGAGSCSCSCGTETPSRLISLSLISIYLLDAHAPCPDGLHCPHCLRCLRCCCLLPSPISPPSAPVGHTAAPPIAAMAPGTVSASLA